MSAQAAKSAEPLVLHEVRDGVGVLTFNLPAKLNGWSPPIAKAYFEVLEAFAKDPDVRAILVTGAGRAFCAGADITYLGDIADRSDGEAARPVRPYWFQLTVGKPIVAAIQGACVGLGFQLALLCDVRFVAEDAKLAIAYVKRGLVGELGMTWLLPKMIGVGPAIDLILSGRNVDAKEALALGLAKQVVPNDALFETAFDYCKTLAATCSPWSMRMLKEQLYTDLLARLDASYARDEDLLAQALAESHFAEGMRAFMEKRPPNFPPLAPELATFDLFGAKSS
jgi:enoyl-CoA hydratase/carnithine racemase